MTITELVEKNHAAMVEKTTRIVAQIWDDAGHEEENARMKAMNNHFVTNGEWEDV